MPENGPQPQSTDRISPFDSASGNFREGGIRDFLSGADTTGFIDSLHIAPASSGQRLGPVRTALFSIPAVMGIGAGAVFGAAGYHSGNASADYDACELKDGVIDPFPQVTIPVGYHRVGNNCVKDATPPPTGTAIGNDVSPTTVSHDVCTYKDGVIDPFVQVTVPVGYHLEGNNCVKDATPPPTGTPIGNDKSPTITPHDTPTPPATATPTRTPENTPTTTSTATPTRTPENTPNTTSTPEVCIGQLKIKKFHDRDESKTQGIGEEGLIWSFNVDEASTSQSPDFSVTTNGDGTAITTVRCGSYTVTEVAMQGWKETTTSPHQVVIGKNQIIDALVGNVQLKPGETPVPTATATRPAVTPVAAKSGTGLANTDLTTREGRFNFFGFMLPALVGFATSGTLFGRHFERRKQGK